jgi:hypothetical protein
MASDFGHSPGGQVPDPLLVSACSRPEAVAPFLWTSWLKFLGSDPVFGFGDCIDDPCRQVSVLARLRRMLLAATDLLLNAKLPARKATKRSSPRRLIRGSATLNACSVGLLHRQTKRAGSVLADCRFHTPCVMHQTVCFPSVSKHRSSGFFPLRRPRRQMRPNAWLDHGHPRILAAPGGVLAPCFLDHVQRPCAMVPPLRKPLAPPRPVPRLDLALALW